MPPPPARRDLHLAWFTVACCTRMFTMHVTGYFLISSRSLPHISRTIHHTSQPTTHPSHTVYYPQIIHRAHDTPHHDPCPTHTQGPSPTLLIYPSLAPPSGPNLTVPYTTHPPLNAQLSVTFPHSPCGTHTLHGPRLIPYFPLVPFPYIHPRPHFITPTWCRKT